MNREINKNFRVIKSFFLFLFLLGGFNFTDAQQEEKYELAEILFQGNKSFSGSFLKEIIYSEETPFWFWKFLNSFTNFGKEPVYFDSLSIEDDLTALRDFYYSNGFFDSKFSYYYSIDFNNKEVFLSFIIDEGVPYTFDYLRLNGLTKLESDLLNNIIDLFSVDSTKRFAQSFIKENTDKSTIQLFNNGYLFAKLDSTVVEIDTLKKRTGVSLNFFTGTKHIISSLEVIKSGEGSDYVETELVKDIVGITEGDIYSLEKIRQSQVRLYRTGLFTNVVVSPKYSDTSHSTVPIEVNGAIGLMNEFAPEIIMNNQQNAFNLGLGGNYARKNFLGNARKLNVSGSFGLQNILAINYAKIFTNFTLNDSTILGYYDARIRIEQPYVFNRPIFGNLEVYQKVEKQKLVNSSRFGSLVGLEFELPSYTFMNFLNTYYNLEYTRESYLRNDSVISNLISVIGVETRSLKVNDFIFPTRGYNLSLLFEEANLLPYLSDEIFGNNSKRPLFYKTQVSFSNYFSVNRLNTSIIAEKIRIGYIHTYRGDAIDIPINRTFYAGGSNSVRGWRARELSNTSDSTKVRGGTFLLESSLEWRFKFGENFGSALFLDIGNTWDDVSVLQFKQFGVASGFGLRFYTPFAAFRVDFGFKAFDPENDLPFTRRKLLDVLEFHFGIGEAF